MLSPVLYSGVQLLLNSFPRRFSIEVVSRDKETTVVFPVLMLLHFSEEVFSTICEAENSLEALVAMKVASSLPRRVSSSPG